MQIYINENDNYQPKISKQKKAAMTIHKRKRQTAVRGDKYKKGGDLETAESEIYQQDTV